MVKKKRGRQAAKPEETKVVKNKKSGRQVKKEVKKPNTKTKSKQENAKKEALSRSMPLATPKTGRSRRSIACPEPPAQPPPTATRRSARNLNKTIAVVNNNSKHRGSEDEEEEEEEAEEENEDEAEEENEGDDESNGEDGDDDEEEDEEEEEEENQDVKMEIDVMTSESATGVAGDVNNNVKQEEGSGVAEVEVKIERDELEEYKEELKGWRCVCLTMEDWSALNEKFKQSKKKVDQEIATLIETSYLPEMPALFQKAVRFTNIFYTSFKDIIQRNE